MSVDPEIKPTIIFEEPAESDQFDNGGHSRTASALADAILQVSDRGGAIGLEGRWGSGKSTVIRLAERLMPKNEKGSATFVVFNYDLWSNQNDDFRRSLLESMVVFGVSRGLLTSSKADKILEQIRGKKKTTIKENNREYSLLGVAFLVLTPIIPFLYIWLSPATVFKNNAAGDMEIVFHWWHIAIVATVLLAYIGFFYRLMSQMWTFKGWMPTRRPGVSFAGGASRAVSMFSRDVENEKVTESIRDEDPTTVEFRKFFVDLLKQLQHGGQRLIFVFDNIDRLTVEKVASVWSEMRVVFAPDTKVGDTASVIAVVPFDREHLMEALDIQSDVNGAGTRTYVDFLRKAFVRSLQVSPPVATDWRRYLDKMFQQAFGSALSADTAYRLFKLLDVFCQAQGRTPTPREIIGYVNDIGALVTQWQNTIPHETLGLFALVGRHRDGGQRSIPDDSVSKRLARIADDPQWAKHFSALSFNVSPDVALQVLMEPQILAAIAAERPEGLVALSSQPGFMEVLPDIVDARADEWASEGGATLSLVASNLDRVDLPAGVSEDVWRAIGQSISQLKPTPVPRLAWSTGLATIVSHQRASVSPTVARHLRDWLSSSWSQDEANALAFGENWVESIDAVSKALAKGAGSDASKEFVSQLRIPGKADFAIGVASNVSRTGFRFSDLKRDITDDDIYSRLSMYVTQSSELLNVVFPAVRNLSPKAGRKSLLQAIYERLNSDLLEDESSERLSLLQALANYYAIQSDNSDARAVLAEAVSKGAVLYHAYQDSESAKIRGIAKWLVVEHQGGIASPAISAKHPIFGDMSEEVEWYGNQIAEAVDGEELVEPVRLLPMAGHFGNWLAYLVGEPDNAFLLGVIKGSIDSGSLGTLHIDRPASLYVDLKRALGNEDVRKLLQRYGGYSQHFDKYIANELLLTLADEFWIDTEQLSPFSSLRERLDAALKAAPPKVWVDELNGEGNLLRLLITRNRLAGLTLPVQNFKEPLRGHAVGILTGTVEITKRASDWQYVIGALRPQTRNSLGDEVLTALGSQSVTLAGVENFLRHYGSIARTMKLSKQPDLSLDKVVTTLVASREEFARSYIVDRAKEIREVMPEATEAARGRLAEAIESLEESSDGDAVSWATRVRKALGLPKKVTSKAT